LLTLLLGGRTLTLTLVLLTLLLGGELLLLHWRCPLLLHRRWLELRLLMLLPLLLLLSLKLLLLCPYHSSITLGQLKFYFSGFAISVDLDNLAVDNITKGYALSSVC